MIWILIACISSVFNSLYALSLKEGLKFSEPTSFTTYFLGLATVFIFIFSLITKKKIIFSWYGILVGITTALGFILYNTSISKATNPGLSVGIFRSQAMLTFIMAYFLFKSQLKINHILGIILIIIGAFIITLFMKKEKESDSTSKSQKKEYSKYAWVFYALIAAFFASFKDIFVKYSLQNPGLNMTAFLLYQFFFAFLTAVVYMLIKNKSIKLQSNKNIEGLELHGKINKYHLISNNKLKYLFVLLLSILMIIWFYFLGKATSIAPNPGIAKGIDTLGVFFTLFFSKYLFKGSAINKKQWIGSVILVIGVVLVSI